MKQSQPDICAIIPARYGSTRLPGKPLLDFHGKTMIHHVYDIVSKVFEKTAVATDDERIVKEVESFGGKAVMTSDHHDNGTSRVSEAIDILGWEMDYLVNVQGDEPMLSVKCLEQLVESLSDGKAELSTLIAPVKNEKELFGESEVFVVRDHEDYALYFSRAVIPYYQRIPHDQWLEHGTFYKHVGLYAYRTDLLPRIIALQPSLLEQSECLEQNRWLEHGYKIKTAITEEVSYPVDSPEDVQLVRDLMVQKKN